MRKSLRLLAILGVNLAILILLSELLFTVYYYHKDGQYLSVPEKLIQEKSSFDVGKQQTVACNKYNNILAPHPYLVFVHVSRPECNSFANNTGHRGPDVPLVKNDQNYVVMILGGSVANQLFQFEQPGIQEYFQKKHPDKHVVILNGSLEGWKQPQQLFMLQMYGEVIDEAISIEGFNEMIFDRRLDYHLRFDAPFLPGYRKANAGFLTDEERSAIWLSGQLFDLVNNHVFLRHSKTAYFFSELIRHRLEQSIHRKGDRNSLEEGTLHHLEKIFVLPDGMSVEQRRDLAIDQYIKYLSLMNATAKAFHIPLAVFLQPAPAIDKPLSEAERKLVDDLGYRDDYLLFEQRILKHQDTLPVYSLLHVFSGVDESIYKDGIHYQEESSGPGRVMHRITQILDHAKVDNDPGFGKAQ